jgi:hypothetical protein
MGILRIVALIVFGIGPLVHIAFVAVRAPVPAEGGSYAAGRERSRKTPDGGSNQSLLAVGLGQLRNIR